VNTSRKRRRRDAADIRSAAAAAAHSSSVFAYRCLHGMAPPYLAVGRLLPITIASGGCKNFESAGGAEDIYRKCSQRIICLLYGKRRLFEKKSEPIGGTAPTAPFESAIGRHLWSADSPAVVVRPTRRSTLGDCAFPVAAARAWNILQPSGMHHTL